MPEDLRPACASVRAQCQQTIDSPYGPRKETDFSAVSLARWRTSPGSDPLPRTDLRQGEVLCLRYGTLTPDL
jgi:hypothetical protein